MKKNAVMENAVITEGLRLGEDKASHGEFGKKAFAIYEKLHGKQPDVMFRSSFGHIMENFKLQEATKQSDMPFLQDYGFQLLTALMPTLIANDIFTIQPTKFKNFSIFYQDFIYQTAKGATAAGADAITSLTADNIDSNYTKDSEVDRNMGTGNDVTASYSLSAGALSVPIVASSISITSTAVGDTALVAIDDGAGALIGDVTGTNTVDYTTGALTVTFDANVKTGEAVLITYSFVGEGSKVNAAEYGMKITEITGLASERRLRYSFSKESEFSYRQQMGRSMDGDLLAGAVSEIRKEIDQALIQLAFTTATGAGKAGSITWDRTPPTGVQYVFHRETFIDTINEGGNLILKATGVGDANVVVGGLDLKQVVETLGLRFTKAPKKGAKGSRFLGVIDGNIKCYYEPSMADARFYVSYKSDSALEPGIVYVPWMPLYTSEPHMLADGQLHRYLLTSSGQKVVNSKYFVEGTLTKS